MLGVAVIGWIFVAAMLLYDFADKGTLELEGGLKLGGLFTLGAALSWGLSALTAISLSGLRPRLPKAKSATARGAVLRHQRKGTPGPWEVRSGRATQNVIPIETGAGTGARSLIQRWRLPSVRSLLLAFAVGAMIGILAFRFLSDMEVRPTVVPNSASFRLCGSLLERNCVIDGDTIRYDGIVIRLADIDTPEISSPKCASELALGERAKHRLLDLLNAGSFEIAPAGSRDEDDYGRKLRIVMRNGQSVGDTLIAEGLARRWDGARRSWCV